MRIFRNWYRTIELLLVKKMQTLPSTLEFKGKVCVVTGTSSGLGKSIAQALTNKGAIVIGLCRSVENSSTNGYSSVQCDITSPDQIKLAVNNIVSKSNSIDVLINNAGLTEDKDFVSLSLDDVESYIDTNLKGPIILTNLLLGYLSKDAVIINVGSKVSRNTNLSPRKVLYATTKYGIEGFTNALKRELRDSGKRVVCIMPATINTFVSTNSGNFLSPSTVAEIICDVIKYKDVDFENFVIKNKYQEI